MSSDLSKKLPSSVEMKEAGFPTEVLPIRDLGPFT